MFRSGSRPKCSSTCAKPSCLPDAPARLPCRLDRNGGEHRVPHFAEALHGHVFLELFGVVHIDIVVRAADSHVELEGRLVHGEYLRLEFWGEIEEAITFDRLVDCFDRRITQIETRPSGVIVSTHDSPSGPALLINAVMTTGGFCPAAVAPMPSVRRAAIKTNRNRCFILVVLSIPLNPVSPASPTRRAQAVKKENGNSNTIKIVALSLYLTRAKV